MICLRFLAGPHQGPDLANGKFKTLTEAHQPIPVFGDDSMARDHTFVDNNVPGVLAPWTMSLRRTGRSLIFNLGNSHPISLESTNRYA
jgi:UDP-glucuronate 4-epimerase